MISHEFGISCRRCRSSSGRVRAASLAYASPELRRIYALLEAESLRQVDEWLEQFRTFWSSRLDALGTELQRSRPLRPAADHR